nr:myb family transcription factor EFM-like [Ipomoea batatas]
MAENSFPSSSFSSASASNPSLLGTLPPSSSADQISTMSDIQPKPRLKWTPELHGRFCEAIQFLGGVQRATPKAILELMNGTNLTLKQVTNHFQIYRSHCFDLEQLARETQAAVAQMAWVPPLPYLYGYPAPLYSAPPPALYSPFPPQPPQQLPPPPPPARLVMDYSAPAPKTIIFKKLFPKGRPIDAEEDVNPGPSSPVARNEGQDDGPLDLTLSIRPPNRG